MLKSSHLNAINLVLLLGALTVFHQYKPWKCGSKADQMNFDKLRLNFALISLIKLEPHFHMGMQRREELVGSLHGQS